MSRKSQLFNSCFKKGNEYICSSKIKSPMINSTKSLLFCLLFLSSFVLNAQNLSFPDGIYYVSGPASTARFESHLQVSNSANNPISILVMCDRSQMISGHQTSYCWALCYDTTVCGISPDQLAVPGRSVDSTSFHSYLYPNNIVGTSIMTYTFFDQNNQADSIVAHITFDALSTGINEVQKGYLSNAYPNPATSITTINYNLPSLNNGHVYLYNVLGVMVKDIILSNLQSMVVISTSDLNSGIYTYTLVNEGKLVSANRLVVSHR